MSSIEKFEDSQFLDNMSTLSLNSSVSRGLPEQTEIKVLQSVDDFIKTFKTPAEFQTFYTKNKLEVDKTSTVKLNKLFNIEGYRICRIKKELTLKKIDEEKVTLSERVEEMEEMINELKSDIVKIKTSLNSVIAFIRHEGQ